MAVINLGCLSEVVAYHLKCLSLEFGCKTSRARESPVDKKPTHDLEDVLQPELELAHIDAGASDLTKTGTRARGIWGSPVGMVGKIKAFESELQLMAFSDPEVLQS